MMKTSDFPIDLAGFAFVRENRPVRRQSEKYRPTPIFFSRSDLILKRRLFVGGFFFVVSSKQSQNVI